VRLDNKRTLKVLGRKTSQRWKHRSKSSSHWKKSPASGAVVNLTGRSGRPSLVSENNGQAGSDHPQLMRLLRQGMHASSSLASLTRTSTTIRRKDAWTYSTGRLSSKTKCQERKEIRREKRRTRTPLFKASDPTKTRIPSILQLVEELAHSEETTELCRRFLRALQPGLVLGTG